MHRRRGQRAHVWRRFAIVAEGASLLRCSSCCGRPGHPFGKSSGEGALNFKCSSYYKTINALLQLHPGMTTSFCFVPLERSVLLRTKKNAEGVAALLTRVEGRSSTEFEGRQLMLSFIAWIRGPLLQSACGRCQYRSSRKQCHESDSECKRDGRGSGDVGEWRKDTTRFVL